MVGIRWFRRPPKPSSREAEKASPKPALRSPTPLAIQGNIFDSYRVSPDGDSDSSAEVIIVDDSSLGKYIVNLPQLDEDRVRALDLLKQNLRNAIPVEAAGSPEQILDYLWKP